jgi:hypothetical protein
MDCLDQIASIGITYRELKLKNKLERLVTGNLCMFTESEQLEHGTYQIQFPEEQKIARRVS